MNMYAYNQVYPSLIGGQAQAASAEDAARENERFDASQHLSQSGCPVEGKYEART